MACTGFIFLLKERNDLFSISGNACNGNMVIKMPRQSLHKPRCARLVSLGLEAAY